MSDLLSPEQRFVLENIVRDLDEGKKEIRLGGYAGTGKTFLIEHLKSLYPQFAVVAFTGKAANVLRSRGVDASTIHSRIYRAVGDNEKEPEFELLDASQVGCRGFIVDEGSMVSSEIYEDLKWLGLPLVFVGDHGQLEPVGGSLNLMKNLDYRLEKIHRNANEIAHFAAHIRSGNSASSFHSTEGRVHLHSSRNVPTNILSEAEQVICAYNNTRVSLNGIIRSALGYDQENDQVVRGEKLIFLKNSRTWGVYNGQQVIASYIYLEGKTQYLVYEENGANGLVPVDLKYLNQAKPDIKYEGKYQPAIPAYGYAITCHKSQGSGYDNGVVFEQRCSKWDHKRWAYTAASRFVNTLHWVLP